MGLLCTELSGAGTWAHSVQNLVELAHGLTVYRTWWSWHMGLLCTELSGAGTWAYSVQNLVELAHGAYSV